MPTTHELSVVVCTHNPRRVFLERTLEALRRQQADFARWELVLLDNASTAPLSAAYDLSWHPHGRHVREDTLGIAAARMRAMREARSDLILFVDDDNLLAPDYITRGLDYATNRPDLGVWGGQLVPEFERPPAEWTRRWWSYLAIRPLERDLQAASPRDYEAIPPTAGEFIRRGVWERYLACVETDTRHLILGLRGSERISGQDTDIALCTFDLGLGAARFRDLVLTHIMPASRLEEPSLLRLVESISFATVVVEALRGGTAPAEASSLWRYLVARFRAARLPDQQGRFYAAELRGRRRAFLRLRSAA
ncbi:MAG TPA: glycosyltransferase [Opitutaceae bacterium]|nr:glycosyltransferase [Opitutaceae bacterium]